MNQNTTPSQQSDTNMESLTQTDSSTQPLVEALPVGKKPKRAKTVKIVNPNGHAPQQLKSLEDAYRRVAISKYLFSCDKMPQGTSAHHRLFLLVAEKLLCAYDKGLLDIQQDLSMLNSFYGKAVDFSLYEGNSTLQALACKLLPSLDSNNVPINYLKLLNSLIDIVNLNILNYSIYIERKIISKYRLFDIIEAAVFTQFLPTESNSAKVEFKQALSQDILNLRKQLIEENYRGLGKSSKLAPADPLKPELSDTPLDQQPSQTQSTDPASELAQK